jgi:hypothetical protein
MTCWSMRRSHSNRTYNAQLLGACICARLPWGVDAPGGGATRAGAAAAAAAAAAAQQQQPKSEQTTGNLETINRKTDSAHSHLRRERGTLGMRAMGR